MTAIHRQFPCEGVTYCFQATRLHGCNLKRQGWRDWSQKTIRHIMRLERWNKEVIVCDLAAKKSDWALEFAYQNRAFRFGDMVMLQVSFDLPMFTSKRQEPLVAAKRAERVALDAERESVLRMHTAELESDLADYIRLGSAIKRQRERLQPLADEKISLAMAAWRGGKGSLTELISARSERIDTELKAIALEGEQRQVAARLHYVYGAGEGV